MEMQDQNSAENSQQVALDTNPPATRVYYYWDEANYTYFKTETLTENPPGSGIFPINWNCTDVPPPETGQYQIAAYDYGITNTWMVKPDYRGVVLYLRTNGQQVQDIQLGDTPESLHATINPRPSADYIYDAATDAWVFDQATADARTLAAAMNGINSRIQYVLTNLQLKLIPLQYMVDAGVATSAQQAAVTSFKQYVVDVYNVRNQPGFPSVISWPEKPADPV
ncbi:MAG: hypothetical protein E6R08_06475 [Nevskiaceae bacterium]|nr:MAG: hypothetical protein E6R08_06475 [Nevskiaceae bacterium]